MRRETPQAQGEVLPGQDSPVGAEVLNESERTRVTRVFLPGRTVVRKEPLGPDAQRRLEHELYAERTREPLVVDDATRDDRFARDPYFAELESCSLLAVPILSRGTLQAVLLLENRLIRGAFTIDRLDAVKLTAGQLAVSLDNAESRAQLMASRVRIVAAADEARARIQRDLHDGAQQHMVALAIRLKLLARSDAARASGIDAELLELITEVDDAHKELRDISQGLHPQCCRGADWIRRSPRSRSAHPSPSRSTCG